MEEYNSIPMFAEQMNILESYGNPNYINIVNTTLYNFYRRYLMQKVFSIFDWNIPDSWSKEFLQIALCVFGYVPVLPPRADIGSVFQVGTIWGRDLYWQPAFCHIINPNVKDADYIGTYRINNGYAINAIPLASEEVVKGDCILLKLTPDYCGIVDIINNFACEMTLAHYSTDINIMQAKDPKVFAADNKNAAEAYKKGMDKAISGDPAIVWNKDLFNADGSPRFMEFTKSLHDTYIADKLLDALRTIENRFDSMIGLSNTNISKRANMTTAEVTANEDEVNALPIVWADTLKRSSELLKRMYNIDVNITLKAGDIDEINIDDNRSV